ncbi:hypothetical protein OGAPHI_003282 [Ogataea philodendri]|uniref:Rap-GAP domain-containing protein n=1 Tax=Ogataea philodendri TaxID=1378263 RepID=A0A9P8P6Q8_9ASCO|nr:uncharacterized protein OGAPHI_003282 [Ogataea philodendri]KAH3666833.1 hypothetical protein OGAPHI_003282 [Ogataea philodendri]
MFKSISKTFRSKPTLIQPSVVGTDLINQKEVLSTLKDGSTSAKITAIRQLAHSIKTKSISSIPELWFLAKQNLDKSNPQSLRHETFNLLLICIQSSDHSVPTKMSYYKDILKYLQTDLSYCIQSLELLTDHGREIYDLLIYQPSPLGKVLKEKLNKLTSNHELQIEFLNFLAECLKFNFNLFDLSDLSTYLAKILQTAKSTPNIDVLSLHLQIIDTYISLGSVPSVSLYPIIQLIGASKNLKNIQIDHICNSMLLNLLSSPNYSLLTLVSCCEVIEKEPGSTLGCFHLIQTYLHYYNDATKTGKLVTDVLNSTKHLVLNALMVSSRSQDREIADSTISLILSMLEHGLISDRHLMSSQFWDLLSQVDGTRIDTDAFSKVLDHLRTLSRPLWRDNLVSLLEKHKQVLSPDQLDFVMETYNMELRCMTVTENWQQNCESLVSTFGKSHKVLSVLETAFYESYSIVEDPQDLKYYVQLIIDPGFWEVEDYQETLAKLLLAVDDALFQNLVSEFPQSCLFVKHLVYSLLVLCQGSRNTVKTKVLFDFLFKTAVDTLKTDHDTFLVVARLLISARPKGNYLCFKEVDNVEGLCDNLGRNTNTGAQLSDTVKWKYPEQLAYFPSQLLKTCNSKALQVSDLSDWLDLVIDVFENFVDWEVYSFVLGHFCPQMACSTLFPSIQQVSRLLRVLCNQLQLKFPWSFNPVSLSKADVQVALIRTLSSIPAYKQNLSRAEEDLLISSVISALQSWDKTGIPCLHFLNVSCYEFPGSIKRFLTPILTILQTRLSSPTTSGPILDLLFSLSELPSLLSNLTIEEYKRIFAIAFKYIEYSQDTFQQKKEYDVNFADSALDKLPSTQSFEVSQQLLLFLTTMSYRAICGWFLKLSVDHRNQMVEFITKHLTMLGLDNTKNQVYYEAINRLSYSESNLNPTFMVEPALGTEKDYQTESWITQNAILTICSHEKTDKSVVVVRRPTSTDRFEVKLSNRKSSPALGPRFLESQLFNLGNTKAVPLQMDDQTRRSIAVMDRMPVVNLEKVGVVYIGPGQTTEREILGNQFGSRQYETFVTKLGNLIRLRNCKEYYVGGLDTQNDLDGKYTVHYHSPVSHVCYHVTTMMPRCKDDDTDEGISSKKRHIGNDFVNIYWNESGESFDFHKIASQFNFVSLVIEPCEGTSLYRVKLYRKAGIPGIFSPSHFKLISEENLASYIRNVSSLCGQFCDIWTNPDWEFSWERRYKQLQMIKARAN